MSHMLKTHLVVQNAAAVAMWYPDVLSATAAQPMAALRFTSRRREGRRMHGYALHPIAGLDP